MKMNYKLIEDFLEEIPISSEGKCSYFNEKRSRAKAFKLAGDVSPEILETLLNLGYRRCGDLYYQQNCLGCNLCICFRIETSLFTLTKSQKRILNKNKDIVCKVGLPNLTPLKENIYLNYQYHQHFQKDIKTENRSKKFDPGEQLDTMYYQMYTNPSCTRETEFYLKDELIGFGITDLGIKTVSAVYFVYNTDYNKRSLGTLEILKGIEWAKENDYLYYHLGFYIPGHKKMDYKINFGAGQFLNSITNLWISDLTEIDDYIKGN